MNDLYFLPAFPLLASSRRQHHSWAGHQEARAPVGTCRGLILYRRMAALTKASLSRGGAVEEWWNKVARTEKRTPKVCASLTRRLVLAKSVCKPRKSSKLPKGREAFSKTSLQKWHLEKCSSESSPFVQNKQPFGELTFLRCLILRVVGQPLSRVFR